MTFLSNPVRKFSQEFRYTSYNLLAIYSTNLIRLIPGSLMCRLSSSSIHSRSNIFQYLSSHFVPICTYSLNSKPPVKSLYLFCSGCGAKFQSINCKLPGFIEDDTFIKLKAKEDHSFICDRCYNLRNEEVPLSLSQSHHKFAQKIGSIDLSRSVILLVVDILCFPVGVYPYWYKLIPDKTPVVILLNKMDLIDNGLATTEKDWETRIRARVLKYFSNGPLKNREIARIEYASALRGLGVQNIARMILNVYGGRNVYLFGCTNSGKSTLFNRLQKNLWLIESSNPTATPSSIFKKSTVSSLPGTTLNNISVPIPIKKDLEMVTGTIEMHTEGITEEYVHPITVEDITKLTRIRSKLYDSPGVDHEHQLVSFLTLKEQKYTVPLTMIRRRQYDFIQGETLLIGGLAKVDFLHKTNSSRIQFHVFCSHKIPLFVVKQKKLESFLDNYQDRVLVVPFPEEERGSPYPQLIGKELTIEGEHLPLRCLDVVVSNLGWLNIFLSRNQTCTIKVYTPKGRGIVTREPLFSKAYLFKSNR
ncbi:nitric oxide-associated protein 1-like [Oopsacas minuta]|uniref:Nitric oxide-associated protein 1-like n=1 Tax=Oopsacas minuta TaxID=111878 RepID=A0AAV7JRQ9_9METZ|nr:nitric oxide-associated protein 1-like [Oopsacas minuta]